jgi:hypothetical protein
VGGQWRLVKIGPVRSGGIHPAAWLGLAALLGFLAFGTSLWPGPIGLLLPVLLAAAAAAVAVTAVRRLAAWQATPAEASFQGQVIARWIERHGNNDSDWDVSCIAVDDGERSWSFSVKDAAFAKLALGDAVAIRAAPRSGELLSLVPLRDSTDPGAAAPGQPAADLLADEPFLRVTPGPPNPLLTAEEVTAEVGRPVEGTGFQLGMLGAIYRGADLTVSLTVARGAMGERAVWAEGKRAGITRPRLSVTARTLLDVGAAAVGALAFAAVHSHPGAGLWAPAATALTGFIVAAYSVQSLGRKDRLTAHGSALVAWADRAVADMAPPADLAALTGMAGSSPADLRRLAWAVAVGAPVGIPGANPGLATGVRPERGRAGARMRITGPFARALRPSAAWSSFGGQWRLVRIGPASSTRMHPAFWLVLASWLALISYVSSLLPGRAGVVVPAVLAACSIAAVIGGARGLAAWWARPAETSFQAHVIARWVERRRANDDDSSITCIALDDGERSWSFDVRGAAFGQLALGDMVTVRASPRSGKLLSLVAAHDGTDGAVVIPDQAWVAVRGAKAAGDGNAAIDDIGPAPHDVGEAAHDAGKAAHDAGEAAHEVGEAADNDGIAAGEEAEPSGALLSASEVSAAVGQPVRATGLALRAASAVYRGEGLTIIVTATDGFLGSLTSLARRRGLPLPGVGDEAWLLNWGRTAFLRVGERTAKVTVGGSAARSLPPDALSRLAAAVAERLPRHVGSPRMQA